MATAASLPSLQAYVSEEIRVVLTRRRRSAAWLAKVLGWSQAQLSRKLSNQVQFSLDELLRVADALEVPMQSLLPAEMSDARSLAFVA